MKLCVMGLGYIGLPTAVMFARNGVQVHGVDVNPTVVEKLKKKELHIEESGLQDAFVETMEYGNLKVSTLPEQADVFIIAVPTPINPDRSANLDYVKDAATMIVPFLQKGNLVVLESTVPPRTVEDVIVPILRKTSFNIGEEILVSHSPERVLPGKLFEELENNDRIVGGINKKSSELTVQLYKRFVKGRIHVTSATTAEMVKLMENTYRDINIAFANELARISEKVGVDIWKSIEMANSHPRVHIHQPGPGVGGHCIAVDPWFIVEQAPREAKLIALARSINDSTPHAIVEKISEMVKKINDPVVTLLGLTFKENIDDIRESPALIIMYELRKKGYKLKMYDPFVKQNFEGKVDSIDKAVNNSDLLVILTGHNVFKHIDYTVIKDLFRTRAILDTRNIVNKEQLKRLSFRVNIIGTSQLEVDEG